MLRSFYGAISFLAAATGGAFAQQQQQQHHHLRSSAVHPVVVRHVQYTYPNAAYYPPRHPIPVPPPAHRYVVVNQPQPIRRIVVPEPVPLPEPPLPPPNYGPPPRSFAFPPYVAPGPYDGKSDYTLLNPTPREKMRQFAPDRPNRSGNPYTIDAGHFQYETDLFGGLSDQSTNSNLKSRVFFTADPVLKLGMYNNADLEIALGGYQEAQLASKTGAPPVDYAGFGDVTMRVKINLWGNDGGPTAFAVTPFVKFPTAADGLGNGQFDGGVVAPFLTSLPAGFKLVITPGIQTVKNSLDDGKHLAITGAFNLQHKLTERLTAQAEFFARGQTANNPSAFTADFALAYLLTPETQIDGAIYAGLNKEAPDVIGYVGLSQRF